MAERTTPLVELNGVAVGRGRTLNFVEGANTDLTITVVDHEAEITVASTGGGGSGVDVEEDNTPIGTADTIDFGTGLDVSFAAGEADITVDTSELTVVTAIVFDGNVE